MASRKTRQLRHDAKPRLGASETAIALARAWTVTTIATTLFVAALAVAAMWDRAVFMRALREALTGDPQLMQPVDAATADPRQTAAALRRP